MSRKPAIAYPTVEDLAGQIADKVLPQARDKMHHDALVNLLVAFAAEIKRGAIEP